MIPWLASQENILEAIPLYSTLMAGAWPLAGFPVDRPSTSLEASHPVTELPSESMCAQQPSIIADERVARE